MEDGNFFEQSYSEIISSAHDLLTTTLFQLQETQVSLLTLIIFLLFLIAFGFASKVIKKMLLNRVLTRFEIESGLRYTLARVSQYIIVTIGVLVSFQFIGIDLSSLAVIFGFLSVGIGFGLQNITSNFISGLIVLFERPISVGDRVVVAGIEGDVLEINIRATKIRTLNKVSIIVPNSEFVSSNVINYSHGDPEYRLDVDVGVGYGSDLDAVLKALREVADENKNVLKNPEPQVHLVSFGDSAWEMQLRVWIPDVKRYPIVRNEINQAIVKKFREHDIEIPFPQRDLHMRSSVDLPVRQQKMEPSQENQSEEEKSQ
ncbi:mechanosensitive ion channel family protein [Rhodohalobacter halophilus]|uniref:mechanosensitive ion channel family protein n=1 Tax=Rhodohalobacter halophilus TaxID=1812810 RepID=UPI00083F6EA8|nr:mechanosensitive ion channel domain-containing protein [Rhodohalobacter halophilus]